MGTEAGAEQARYVQAQGRLTRDSGFRWEAIDDEWKALFNAYVGEGMYQRDVLDAKTRELCAIAALVVLNQQRILKKHILGALSDGATPAEVLEVCLQMSVIGGFPATHAALESLRDTLAETEQSA